MKLKDIKFVLLIIMSISLGFTVSAQVSTSLYFMKDMPQANLYNPALHNDSSKVIIGLPFLSGLSFDINGDFAINDLIHYGTGTPSDSITLDIEGFYSVLKDQNYFRQSSNVNLLFFGIRKNKVFYDFSVTEKQYLCLEIDKDFVGFLKDGNTTNIGIVQNLGDIDVDFMHYRELAFGASTFFMNGFLSLGVKAKVLFGKFSMQTEKLNFQVATADDSSSLTLDTDMQINFTTPMMSPDYDADGYLHDFDGDFKFLDYMFASDNMGMAFDLGAVFKVNTKMTVSASLLDIGIIIFDTDAYNVNLKDSYDWEGLDFSNSQDESNSGYIRGKDKIEQEMDKLEAVVRPKRENIKSGSFNSKLPVKMFCGVDYLLSEKVDIGLLDRLFVYDGESQNAIALSVNTKLKDYLSMTGTYSVINGSYNNFGLGLALRSGSIQFYMVNDNILALTDPAKARLVNIRFGMNILFEKY